MWTDPYREYFLGSRDSFEARYCRGRQHGRLATLSADRILQSYLSRLIFKLTCVLPALSHRSPGWAAAAPRPHPKMPIIVMGKMVNRIIERRNRCGLCEVDGRVYFWLDTDNGIFNPVGHKNWIWWRTGNTGNDHQYRYMKPISPDVVPGTDLLDLMVDLNIAHGDNSVTKQLAPDLWLREPSRLQPVPGANGPGRTFKVPSD